MITAILFAILFTSMLRSGVEYLAAGLVSANRIQLVPLTAGGRQPDLVAPHDR